ncbi:MAG TPA: dihydrolipoamide acetyltransferase family protein [Gemmatimonadales bacterium]
MAVAASYLENLTSMAEFRMPLLGADMVAGTLTEWYKHPGDTVRRGDLIAAVDTDKGSIDVEVFEDGVVERMLVEPGQKVPVGTVLAIIATPGGAAPPSVLPGPAVTTSAPAPAPSPPSQPARPEVSPGAAVRASPLARRVAADLGIDLTRVRGTGPGGAIQKEDVEAFGKGRPPEDPTARMRRAIAAAMTRSKREIPHFYVGVTLDFGPATAWLAQWNDRHPPAERLLPAVLLLKATALALAEFPELNARWENDQLKPSEAIHLGVVTSLRAGGLVVPAIHHANRKTCAELMSELRDLVQRARTGTLRSSDLTDGTVSVTNLGERGADRVFGIIYPPQTALVGFGAVATRPWVVANSVVARPVVEASLSGDHRASDGHRGSAFLGAIGRLLEHPEAL